MVVILHFRAGCKSALPSLTYYGQADCHSFIKYLQALHLFSVTLKSDSLVTEEKPIYPTF